MSRPVLSPAQLAGVTDIIYRWTGMTFGESKRFYIERRIEEGMRRMGAPDAAAYLAALVFDGDERERLTNAFTINETYFYREDHQLAALTANILPEIIRHKQPGDLIRIWSLPCSTGDEAYSIAIWLLENWRLVDAYNVEIVGSDIDTDALDLARAGAYPARSLARLPAHVVETYFEASDGKRRRIIGDLRESVQFSTANLVDRRTLTALGQFDVILCRNLLIYFDEASRLVAAANLFDALNPGGYLCLGHSESLSRISDRFTLVRLADAIVYRRP